jgi:hypothetical protein
VPLKPSLIAKQRYFSLALTLRETSTTLTQQNSSLRSATCRPTAYREFVCAAAKEEFNLIFRFVKQSSASKFQRN